MSSETESFPHYKPDTDETGDGFYVFVVLYTTLSFLIIAPLVIWGRKYQRERDAALSRVAFYSHQNEFAATEHTFSPQPQEEHPHHQHLHPSQVQSGSPFRDPRVQQPIHAPLGARAVAVRSIFRGIDRVATTSYPDEDPDYISILSGSQNRPPNAAQTPNQVAIQPTTASLPSNVPSAATTSRLYARPSSTPKTQVWDVRARRWKSRRPIGRPEVVHQAFKEETESMGGSSHRSQRKSLRRSRFDSAHTKSHGMSDVASSILTDDLEGPPFLQQRVTIYSQRRHRRENSTNSSDPSFLFYEVVDDISPNDAADAADPGRHNSFDQVEQLELAVCCGPGALWRPRTIATAMDCLVELAEPDLEMRRILEMGIPLTLAAVSHSFLHLVTMSVIANCISTDAMVAYVIVHLMLGFTNELIGAISDAESTLCAHALSMGCWLLAGQYGQIAVLAVLLVNIPIMFMWATVMDDLVLWLVASQDIADIAQGYTIVILAYQLLQGVSRALTVLIHLSGHEKFESRIAFGESIVMALATCFTAAFAKEATLRDVGSIQLIIGSACFVAKVAYALLRGWLGVFLKGLLRSCAVRNLDAVATLLLTTVPLLIGAFLEYGEWEILLFFISTLGPAEVATWAVVGVLWQLLESSTEGFGEAAAIRVAYHLGSGNAVLAQHASHKALLVATAQSLFITSILLMAGKNMAKVLTPDPVLQTLLSSLIVNVALGSLVMNFAMNVWSLLGAQGRYRLATVVILLTRWFVTMPVALMCIYGFNLDLNSIMGAVTTGFATSVWALSYIFFRSDWERLSRVMRELNAMLEVDSDSDDDSDDDEDDSDSEDHEERSGDGAADRELALPTDPV